MIQKYVDGESIYIPRKMDSRQEWGKNTQIKQELVHRNMEVFEAYTNGSRVSELAKKYFLSEKSIQRILREMKK